MTDSSISDQQIEKMQLTLQQIAQTLLNAGSRKVDLY